MKHRKHFTCMLLSVLLLFGTLSVAGTVFAEESSADSVFSGVADASQMTTVEEVVEEGMVPVSADQLLDGSYAVEAESSSSMFRITDCLLTVEDGAMTATINMSGTAYLYVFPGSAAEAAAADQDTWIPYEENEDGSYRFTIPVEALDQGIPCAAWSRNKELWYDRTLLFRADSLPLSAYREGILHTVETLGLADGLYQVEVSLSGGSGRARIESPAQLTVSDGACTARIVWGSRNYDYMRIGEEILLPLPDEETSVYLLPVPVFDRAFSVIADTVAMNEPHEITYRLCFDSESITSLSESSEGEALPLQYAEQFSLEAYKDSSWLLTLAAGGRFLLLPEGLPTWGEDPVIRIPVRNAYVASSSVPDLFLHCGAIEAIRLTGTDAPSWRIPAIRDAVESGKILYAGKYSAPDYELLLEEECDLVIENTMILHNPAVREKLEALGLPVLLEYSSYEPHPMGRLEWVRLYGILTGHAEEAEAFFEEQARLFRMVSDAESTGRTVAFFYLNTAGAAVVRSDADYVTRMIALAGGESCFRDLPESDSSTSSISLQMEDFYRQAVDADVLIYNSTIAGELEDLSDFLALNPLLQDFRAVRERSVWCTEQSMFQESSACAGMIRDLHTILAEEDAPDTMQYLHRLN